MKAENATDAVNEPVGGDGGKPFSLTPSSPDVHIKAIKVWEGWMDGLYIIRALRVVWTDDVQSELVGNPDGAFLKTKTLREGETIQEFKVRAGTYLDGIDIFFSTGHGFSAGGPGGTEHNWAVGNGRLVSFGGRSWTGIDKLGSIFQS